jgi:hypothetical protein
MYTGVAGETTAVELNDSCGGGNVNPAQVFIYLTPSTDWKNVFGVILLRDILTLKVPASLSNSLASKPVDVIRVKALCTCV